jgi:hypothetical protein
MNATDVSDTRTAPLRLEYIHPDTPEVLMSQHISIAGNTRWVCTTVETALLSHYSYNVLTRYRRANPQQVETSACSQTKCMWLSLE